MNRSKYFASGLMLLTAALNVNAANAVFEAGDAVLCGSLAEAASKLRQKGYLDQYPSSMVEQMVKAGHIQTDKRSADGTKTNSYYLQAKNGNIVVLQYTALGYDNVEKTFEKMVLQAKGIFGTPLKCVENPRGKRCRVNKGAEHIVINFLPGHKSINVKASIQCK